MASINLAFREWPFLPLNKGPKNPSLKTSSCSTIEMEFIKQNLPVNLIQKKLTTQPSYDSTIDQSTNNNSLINYSQFSSWGRCGLFASTNESCLSIFSNDKDGNLTPMYMFSPFDAISIGKVSKQPQKSSFITAIAWSDGHLEPSCPKSILAAGSEKGHLVIYDFSTKDRLGHFRFEEPIVSILWCSFKQNRFYVGTRKGHFFICEVTDHKTIEILKVFDFSVKSSLLSDATHKSIDYITQDDINGHTIGIASKDHLFGFIKNINDVENSEIQIYQNFSNKEANDMIQFFEFYPNSDDFVTISMNSSSFFLSISKGTLIQFIQSPNCKFISFIDSENDKVIVGNDSELNVWQLVDQLWVRLSSMNIGYKNILTFSKHNDKILITTSSNWLNQIEFKRNKLFITKRIKLIDGSIVDFDFGDGSIAFLSSNNTISLTSPTPESVIKPLFSSENLKEQLSSSNEDDYENEGLFYNNSKSNIELNKIDSDDCDESETSSSSKYRIDESIHGNSNSLSMSFSIDKEIFDLKHVKWISSDKIVAWCRYSFYLIDLKTRSITEPFSKKFCKNSVKITRVFSSKSRRILGIVIDNVKVYLMDTKMNLKIIKSFDFSDKIVNKTDLLLGSISPNENEVVFTLSNFLYFTNLNEKESLLKKIKTVVEFKGSFISWENRGIFIGTEKGGALLISHEKIESIIEKGHFGRKSSKILFDSINSDKLKLETIKLILPCSNQRYIIIDSNHKGIILSNEIKIIAENIKAFKQFSEDNYLIGLQNYNRLAAINSYNELVTSLPPCFYLSQEKKNNINEFKNNNNNNFAISYRNNIQLLNEFISAHDDFNSLSSKNFLKLGDLEKARNLFLKSNPNDKDYLNNMMLAAFYNTNSDSAKLVVNNFLSNNLIDDAVNVLLMTNERFSAADILSKNGRNEDAYRVLMLNDQKENNVNAEKIILKVADSLIRNKENILFGLKLLSSFGYYHKMINYIDINIL